MSPRFFFYCAESFWYRTRIESRHWHPPPPPPPPPPHPPLICSLAGDPSPSGSRVFSKFLPPSSQVQIAADPTSAVCVPHSPRSAFPLRRPVRPLAPLFPLSTASLFPLGRSTARGSRAFPPGNFFPWFFPSAF